MTSGQVSVFFSFFLFNFSNSWVQLTYHASDSDSSIASILIHHLPFRLTNKGWISNIWFLDQAFISVTVPTKLIRSICHFAFISSFVEQLNPFCMFSIVKIWKSHIRPYLESRVAATSQRCVSLGLSVEQNFMYRCVIEVHELSFQC